MRLNETQISIIDNELEKQGVAYIDYKFEIIDHIATHVENIIDEKGITFDEAFSFVLEEWKPRFNKLSNPAVFGFIWVLPAILMQRAKKMFWKQKQKLFFAAIVFTPILLLFKEYLTMQKAYIFFLICVIFALEFLGYIAIRISEYKTTFGFLYKQQFLSFLFLYYIVLINLNSESPISERSFWPFYVVFSTASLLITASIVNFLSFKEHFKTLKRINKFI